MQKNLQTAKRTRARRAVSEIRLFIMRIPVEQLAMLIQRLFLVAWRWRRRRRQYHRRVRRPPVFAGRIVRADRSHTGSPRQQPMHSAHEAAGVQLLGALVAVGQSVRLVRSVYRTRQVDREGAGGRFCSLCGQGCGSSGRTRRGCLSCLLRCDRCGLLSTRLQLGF